MSRRFIPGVLLAGLIVQSIHLAAGQVDGLDSFEVASIKKSPAESLAAFIRYQGNTLTIRNMTVRELLWHAFGGAYQRGEIVGGPEWIDRERFDIMAKTERPSAPAMTMLRSLMVERFGVRTHEETRVLPIFSLNWARADRRFGPQLTRSDRDCSAGRGKPPSQGGCGRMEAVGRLVGGSIQLPELLEALAGVVQRRVVDATGLSGDFDVDLTWQADLGDSDPRGVSIFTAIEEQLGLKLQPGNAMVPVMVIDSVERPSEN